MSTARRLIEVSDGDHDMLADCNGRMIIVPDIECAGCHVMHCFFINRNGKTRCLNCTPGDV